jgi:hypothetical protein
MNHHKERKTGAWNFKEDISLYIAVRTCGTKSWINVSRYVAKRTDIQVRERWCNILDPSIEFREWTEMEENQLLSIVEQSKKFLNWTEIARHFRGRTDNNCWRKYTLLTNGRKRKR